MSYVSATDFLGLVRRGGDGSSVQMLEMPGLDYVLAALARARMFYFWAGQAAPTSNQIRTVWLRPAQPSWSAEGAVWLWDVDAGAFTPATPELWAQLLSPAARKFQSVASNSGIVKLDTTLLAVQRNAPTVTTLSLPTVVSRGGSPLQIVDWSTAVTQHIITAVPAPGDTIMRLGSWLLYSTPDQLGGVTLYPSSDLQGWVITP